MINRNYMRVHLWLLLFFQVGIVIPINLGFNRRRLTHTIIPSMGYQILGKLWWNNFHKCDFETKSSLTLKLFIHFLFFRSKTDSKMLPYHQTNVIILHLSLFHYLLLYSTPFELTFFGFNFQLIGSLSIPILQTDQVRFILLFVHYHVIYNKMINHMIFRLSRIIDGEQYLFRCKLYHIKSSLSIDYNYRRRYLFVKHFILVILSWFNLLITPSLHQKVTSYETDEQKVANYAVDYHEIFLNDKLINTIFIMHHNLKGMIRLSLDKQSQIIFHSFNTVLRMKMDLIMDFFLQIQFYFIILLIIKTFIMLRFANKKRFFLQVQRCMFAEVRTVGNIDFQQEDSFLKVVLNRPKALNSLDLNMIKDIESQIPTITSNKAFWIQGAGGKAFCAGGDIKALFEKGATIENRLAFFRHEFRLDYKVSQLKALQIANWDGIVMGGGFGVTSFAPFIIATENTMFAMPQCKLGFFPDVGSSYLLSRLRNNIGFYLGMTGLRLKGEQVYLAGLANYFIHRQNLGSVYNEIKAALPSSSNPKESIKKILDKYHRPSDKKIISHEQQIKQIFGLGSIKEIYKRVSSDSDAFCQIATKALNQQCPVSVGVAHRLVTSARTKSIQQCFIQDFNICQHEIVDPNFAQGVRTVLVQRGSVPNWSHKHILDVTDACVDRYFQWPSTFETLAL